MNRITKFIGYMFFLSFMTEKQILSSDLTFLPSPYTIENYNPISNQITINSLTYDRISSEDVNINKWIYKSGSPVVLNGEDKRLKK